MLEDEVSLDLDNHCSDIICQENPRGYFTNHEFKKRQARVLSKSPGPTESFLDALKFNLSPMVLKMNYRRLMYSLEEKAPLLYSALTRLGFPTPPH